MSLKGPIPTGSLRRSSRTVVLKQNEEAQKALTEQNSESKTTHKKKTLLNIKKTNVKKTNAKKTTTTKKKSVEVNDDGFILDDDDDDDNQLSTQQFDDDQLSTPQFDELEIWKQYQNFDEDVPDDGFILDNDSTSNVGSNQDVNDVVASINRKRKLPGNAGKKISKKKKHKSERKWLKKLFNQSVVIAEPQDTDSGGAADGSTEDQESITIQVPVDKCSLNYNRTHFMNGNGIEQSLPVISNGPGAPVEDSFVRLNTASPNKTRGDENGQCEKADEIHREWEHLQLSSGLSMLEFKECLLKQYKEKRQTCIAPPTKCDEPAQEVSTRYIDLTSNKCEADNRKKRYKMELSLPEKTTILVTNLVQRDSPLPKVIFMLKKPSSDGDGGSPLLMECSGGANKQQSQVALQKELQEITQQFLRLPKRPEDNAVPTNPRPISEAIEYSVTEPNK